MTQESTHPTYDLQPSDENSMEEIEKGFKRIALGEERKASQALENLRIVEALRAPFNIGLPRGMSVDSESIFPVLEDMLEKIEDLRQRLTDKSKMELGRRDAVGILEVAKAHGLVKAPVSAQTDPELLVLVLDELKQKLANIKYNLPPTGKVGLSDRGFGGD